MSEDKDLVRDEKGEVLVVEVYSFGREFKNEISEEIKKATELEKVLEYASEKVRVYSWVRESKNFFEVYLYDDEQKGFDEVTPNFISYIQNPRMVGSYLMGLMKYWEEKSNSGYNFNRSSF